MIRYIAGDILNVTTDYIAQGVAEGNQEGLGTGLALEISRKYPDVQTEFKRFVRSNNYKGGDIWVCPHTSARPGFLYLATQPDMYQAKLSYLRKALRKLSAVVSKHSINNVYMPKIGAGLGKLSWEKEVKPLYEHYLSECKCQFKVIENYRKS